MPTLPALEGGGKRAEVHLTRTADAILSTLTLVPGIRERGRIPVTVPLLECIAKCLKQRLLIKSIRRLHIHTINDAETIPVMLEDSTGKIPV